TNGSASRRASRSATTRLPAWPSASAPPTGRIFPKASIPTLPASVRAPSRSPTGSSRWTTTTDSDKTPGRQDANSQIENLEAWRLACRQRARFLIHPVRDKHVRLPFDLPVPVRREHQATAVGREHRETVEGVVERHLLEPRAIQVDQEDVEVPLLRILDVGREDQPTAVGMPRRRETRRTERRQLTIVAAVAIHHVELQLRRPPDVILQQREVVGVLGAGRQRPAAIRDPLAVP